MYLNISLMEINNNSISNLKMHFKTENHDKITINYIHIHL